MIIKEQTIVNYEQTQVVWKVDNAIHRINHYPADSVVLLLRSSLRTTAAQKCNFDISATNVTQNRPAMKFDPNPLIRPSRNTAKFSWPVGDPINGAPL